MLTFSPPIYIHRVFCSKAKGSIVMVHRVGFAIPTAFRRGALNALQHLLSSMTPDVENPKVLSNQKETVGF